MEVIASANQTLSEPVCLMIGNFDGLHLGHQSIIARARSLAQAKGFKTAVLSFEPHPLKVLAPEKAPKLLQTPSQKRALLARHEIDYYLVQRFDEALSMLSPEEFVANLKRRINFRMVLVGFNFRFGFQRKGTPETLKELAEKFDYSVVEIEDYQEDGHTVSSSRIRDLVANGHVDEAAALLRRPYFLEGFVDKGHQIGGTINAPTANIHVENELLPKFGVYASWSRVEGQWYRSITNIGMAPTMGYHEQRIETHFFNLRESLYGKHMLVCLGYYLRPEIKFDSLEALKNQIQIDIQRRLKIDDTEFPDFTIL